jgi:type VII secretion-associated serine protease mycosin
MLNAVTGVRVAACAAAVCLGLAGATGSGAPPARGVSPAPGAGPLRAGGPAWAAVSAKGIRARVRTDEMPDLRAMRVTEAWKISKGRGVTVGVLDTGVDRGVPDLAGSVTAGPDFTRGADPRGYRPPHLHGTFIASLIAGHGSGPGHAGGVIGIAPAAKILSVRVLLDDDEPGFAIYNTNSAYDDAIGRGIRYAVNHGAGVINMSLGSPSPSPDTRAAIGYAISRGVVVVAAAGNDGSPGSRLAPFSYPASFTGVISVAAVTARGTRASFSQRNSSVVISAPGVGVAGAGPGGSYVEADGTSPASAFVSGVAALVRASYPGLSPALVAEALVTSTRHRPPAGYDPGTGFGEVDAVAALRAAQALAAARPAVGLAASRYFPVGRAGPGGAIEVVHHDVARVAAEAGVAAVTGLGFLASLILLGVLARRSARERRLSRVGAGLGVLGLSPPEDPPQPA